MNALIVIPALNEAQTIYKVVKEVRGFADVLVTDDGSTDNTVDLAREAGAIVISNPGHSGYEENLCNGFEYAKNERYDCVVTLDADGQHSASDCLKVLDGLAADYDLVVTNRDQFNRTSEFIVSFFSKLMVGTPDLLSGLKGYKLGCMDYPFDTKRLAGIELALRYIRENKKTQNIKISIKCRQDLPRFGRGMKTEFKILKLILYILRLRSID